MILTEQEVKYLISCVQKTSSFTKARAEQVDHPGMKHEEIKQKLEDYYNRLHQ